jgi:hypothetical protein
VTTQPSDAPAPRAGGLRRIALNVVLAGTALVVALLLAEVVVRLVAPQQLIEVRPDIWAPADSVGWVNRADVRTTINTGEGTVHLYTDAEGMRVGASGRHDAPTRVLIIGDSFMEALQVEYEKSFAALLETSLAAQLGRPVAVYDAGVDGWDPPQYLIRARQLLNGRHYGAVVVAVYLGNDVVTHRVDYIPPRVPTVHHRLRVPRRPSWGELVDAVLRPANDILKTRSDLYILGRTQLHTLLMRLGLTGEYFPEELRRSQAASPRWDITADLCRDIAVSARAHGVPTLFVLIPTPFALDSATFDQARRGFGLRPEDVDLDQPTKKMAAALGARGLDFLDVLPGFRAAAARGSALYGHVDRHLTPAGHVLLTQLVTPALAAALTGTAAAPLRTGAPARRAPGNPGRAH